MKQTLHISAAFDQPEFVQNLVERLAYRRYEQGFGKQQMPLGLKAIETSSTETYVSGTMAIDFNDGQEPINMPFITCFNFTCIKGDSEPYQLIWSSSLN
ncbi:MAG: hypothetical protein IPP02_15500 [Chitinophagaceae bacterium]|nr:hypothetical protein [Chitinophagaceae bacterium]MBK9939756.1 hypothetical protein [Chitinophagaceae bacterium]MBL0067338.1 hypothetical protein [Chitinophagaceae bacterium]